MIQKTILLISFFVLSSITNFNSKLLFGKNQFIAGFNDFTCLQSEYTKKVNQTYPFFELKTQCWTDDQEIEIDLDLLNHSSISFGLLHYCITDTLDSLFCRGDNSHGQTNVPSIFYQSTELFSTGFQHTCAVNRLSFVLCWGDDTQGQLGIPEQLLQNSSGIITLISGAYSNCVRYEFDLQIFCWGRSSAEFNRESDYQIENSFQGAMSLIIGANDTICVIMDNALSIIQSLSCWGKCEKGLCDIPSKLKQKNKVISVGYYHACTITTSELGCWGDNTQGQTTVPTSLLKHATSVGTGDNFTCAITINNFITCWGSRTKIHSDLQLFTSQVTAGGRHSCGLTGGIAHCWGEDTYSQTQVPTEVKQSAMGIAANWDQSCAQDVEQHPACWGLNQLGQTDVPSQISKGRVIQISTGLSHACALQKGLIGVYQVKCWGGHNEFMQASTPIQVRTIWFVDCGDDFTCQGTNQVRCQGNNSQGQLDTPKIYGIINNLRTGGAHACVLMKLENVILLCWGGNYYGQSTVPKNISIQDNINQLATGAAHTCIATSKNINKDQSFSVFCWGLRTSENLENEKIMWPVLVEAGQSHDCVVGLLGSLYCWGSDEDGQCTIDQSIRQQARNKLK